MRHPLAPCYLYMLLNFLWSNFHIYSFTCDFQYNINLNVYLTTKECIHIEYVKYIMYAHRSNLNIKANTIKPTSTFRLLFT